MLCARVICALAFCAVSTAHTRTNEWTTTGSSYSYGGEERILGEPYTLANINVTYEDEHGEMYSETSEVGKYGEGYVGSSYGVIVHVRSIHDSDDHSGCSWPLVTRDERPDEPWIALVRRGKCNFEIKVQNAWRSNASAILVYNDRDSSSLDKMRLNTDRNRNMSAVFTYKWKGEEIARLVENGTRVMVAITPGRECIRQYNNINRTSVLFVSISFIVLMIISLAWLIFYYIQRFRYIHAKDRLSKRLCNAAKKALSKIPVKNLKSEDKEVLGDGECCAVCIEPYKISEILRSLPCKHEFHKSCIDPWLLEHRTCPMCKMDILKYYGFVFTGSQESILQLEAEEGRARPARPTRQPIEQLTREPSFVEPNSERSSRASSPDEFSPTLPSSHESMGVTGGAGAAGKGRTPSKASQPRRSSSTNEAASSNSRSIVRIDMPRGNQD